MDVITGGVFVAVVAVLSIAALVLQRRFGASTGLATIAHRDTSPDIWRQYSAYHHVPMASVVVVLESLSRSRGVTD
jgi:hypothetical protein